MDICWEFALIYCAPVSSCKPAYWTWQPIATDYKNHPVVQIRISGATNCKAKCKTDHDWEQIPKQRFMSDHIGNILVCETMTHCFLFVCFFSAIMLIFFMWVELFWAWPSYTRILLKNFLFEIPMQIRDTYYACCRLLQRRMLTPGFFPFFSIIDWVENSIAPSRLVSRHSCRASYRLTVRGA